MDVRRLMAASVQPGVVLAPNWLGDAIMCLPALAALRAATPEGETWTILARPAVAPVFRMARLEFAVKELSGGPRSLAVAGARAQAAILFPNSFRAALLALRLGARRRLGYARDGRGWLLRPAVPVPEAGSLPGHEAFYYLELLRRGGQIEALPADDATTLRVPLHPEARAVMQWREKLGSRPVVAMHVGATFGTAKRWLPKRFAEVAGTLAAKGVIVALIGSRGERELAMQVRMQAQPSEGIKNFCGETTLEELAALLRTADVLVANDSGPMHLAGAVGTPVVAIFGSTNARETYPLTPPGGLRLIQAPGIECSPCKLRECPIDHRCMTRITVAEVLDAVKEVLCSAPPRG